MKTIKGDLILTEDTTFNESIKVEGNITGCFDLKVFGNIVCRDIDCWNIDCRNIVCCDKIKAKGKVKCRYLIKDRFSVEAREWDLNK
jgi:hypothetical protein